MRRIGNRKLEFGNRKLHILIWHLAFVIWPFTSSPAVCRADGLTTEIEKITGTARFKTAHWGILIVETKSGASVYEHQPDKLFAPASVTKLFSTAAALDALGADYRFRTPIYARGKIDDQGRLDGDLILVASGDPTLGGRTDSQGRIAFTDNDHIYAQFSGTAELTPQDPLAGLAELARQVAAKGVRRVGGDVRVDDRLFDHAESTGSGPDRVTPIMVNDNLLDVIVEPALAAQPAKVRWRPETAAVQVDAAVQTVEKGEPRLSITAAAPHKLVVRGSIAVGAKPLVRTHEVEDPARFARALLIEALRRSGIEVAASPLAGNSGAPALPETAAYAGMTKVAELVSPPFSESAKLVLKVSHNLHASAIPLWIAVKHGKRTLADGMKLEGEFFTRCGLEKPSVSFGGAAGGA
jgi:D-alanyl-D-alanine carboxypeptidase/D-alanyl-D-alanine-endopeptidase (penicillin-binding protein 4)